MRYICWYKLLQSMQQCQKVRTQDVGCWSLSLSCGNVETIDRKHRVHIFDKLTAGELYINNILGIIHQHNIHTGLLARVTHNMYY